MPALSAAAQQIWDMKYRLKSNDGEPVDESIEETWRRVARALARPETEPEAWVGRFEEALHDFRFMPAGRILAGAGTGRRVTLFNCFVMGNIPDDMAGIFTHLKEAALTLQQGGGIGYDFSTLRPRGAEVRGVGADASGPLSFMDVWDAMCRTIMSAGSRRGAMMATLRCDHPDIEDFVEAKREPGRLRMFNLSVLVTDDFMHALREDRDWPLRFGGKTYRVVRARALWDKIMRSTYDSAEPGVIFIDRINRRNNLWYCEEISATNPCGEQPLPPYGACLLGSINLARLVQRPFEAEAALDMEALEALVPLAVRMLDNAIDVSRFPLRQQRHEARDKRRIGLGVTGLADALIMCGLRYGSPGAIEQTKRWMTTLRRAAYLASCDLAREKGAFPLYERDRFLAGEAVQALEPELREAIAAHGMRNALVTSVAPTGTISLLADNVSSGLEPVFSFHSKRAILMPDGSRQQQEISDYAYRLFRAQKGEDAALPEAFVAVEDLTPTEHVAMQAAVQDYIDSSVSKTINVPVDTPFEAFKDVYLQAYESGCKGCTTYRPNPITGAVLVASGEEPDAPAVEEAAGLPEVTPPRALPAEADVVYMSEPLERPEVLPGRTYKLRWPGSDHAIYITMNDVIQDARRRPFEIFINSKNMEHYAWTLALTRMISAVFRRGGDVSFVVEELKAVFDPQGGAWQGGKYVPSLLAAIGAVIERHMVDIGFLPSPE
ncbi:MAG: adenosylcobalamin-dependent ribonucleoside-diphosphate reductase, partial [Kiloniellales bacterium]|nr:adenosylcobalamin-dependent ribonucleoside-diphosphate reductase [Kiloniellales bacterium]